jgi:hypothetical protein
MSHKTKKNRHAYYEKEPMQRSHSSSESSEESTAEMVKRGVTGAGAVLMGIGIAGGAAALYLLRTERGRELSSQIRDAVTDGGSQIQNAVNEGISRIRETVSDLAGRLNINIGEGEEEASSDVRSNLRRVV